jgi:hypothetical protein
LLMYTLVPVGVVFAFFLPGECMKYKDGIRKFLNQCQKCGQTIVWANMQIFYSKHLPWQFLVPNKNTKNATSLSWALKLSTEKDSIKADFWTSLLSAHRYISRVLQVSKYTLAWSLW